MPLAAPASGCRPADTMEWIIKSSDAVEPKPEAQTGSSHYACHDSVPSPCVQVCTLDEGQICTGCRRSLDEIVGWPGMSNAEKRAVLSELSFRSL